MCYVVSSWIQLGVILDGFTCHNVIIFFNVKIQCIFIMVISKCQTVGL